MTVYIGESFEVYTTPAENRIAVETDAFDGMPKQVIECYIFVPKGRNYTKHNGNIVHGEFIQPWVTAKQLDNAQREYERQLLADYYAAIAEASASAAQAQYEADMAELQTAYQEGVNSI